jgi:hypothetical protein
MDIKVVKNSPETKMEEKNPKKIWIIILPVVILSLIFVMVKLFIIDPLSSNEKPNFEAEAAPAINKSAIAGSSNQKSSNLASKTTPAPAQSSVTPEPQPETSTQQNTETTATDTATNTETTPETAVAATATPSQSDKFILKSPIEVSEINKISKFRSCTEKAYGETSFQDQAETGSSLKHYFNLKDSNVPIYAPFDGEIIHETSSSLVIETRPFNGWLIDISGINPDNSLIQGSQVKNGDKIGKSSEDNIEISISGFKKSQKEEKYKNYKEQDMDSFFSHLNDSVSTEFSGKGATTDTMIVSKTDRDSKKCDFKPDNDEDWTTLK